MLGLTEYQFIELRIKCFDSVIKTCSKHDIDKDTAIVKANTVWDAIVKPLMGAKVELPEKAQPKKK